MTKIQDVNTVSTTLWAGQLSCVAASSPRACHNIASGQRGKTQAVHHKLESYLAVIFRHCVRRDPDNQIRLRSPTYSPAMLIKWLRYRHEFSSYPARKKVHLFTSAIRFLRTTVEQDTKSRSEITTHVEGKIVELIINMHVFMNWMPDCNINRVFVRIFCPICGWRRRPRGTGSTCVRTVHDQLYVSLGMVSPLQLPLLIGWQNLMPKPMVITK